MRKKFFSCLSFVRGSFVAVAFLMASSSSLFSSRSTSRYFPFLERSDEYITRNKSHFSTGLFITSASTAFGREGGNAGIPELWGRYNLKSVIAGLDALKVAQGFSGYNPFDNEIGYVDWNKKDIFFSVNGKIKSRGINFNGEQHIGADTSVGFFIPVMQVNSSISFDRERSRNQNGTLDSDSSVQLATLAEVDMLSRVRRQLHSDLGLVSERWTKAGLGDLDLHVRWRHGWDYVWRMRSIEVGVQGGVLVPTGEVRDEKYPASIPFMGNGHWGAYIDLFSEFELKQSWRVGAGVSAMDNFGKREEKRISYAAEPTIFSALCGDVSVNPGVTLKCSAYVTRENLNDGLHAQFRYTYLRHNADTWIDKRKNKCVLSYLGSSAEGADCVRATKKRLSEWRSHYLTMQVTYDSVEAMKRWWLEPKFYASLDYCLGGRGISKTHQFTVGVQVYPW